MYINTGVKGSFFIFKQKAIADGSKMNYKNSTNDWLLFKEIPY